MGLVVVADLLRQKSTDSGFQHNDFLRDCLKSNVSVPTGLLMKLLDEEILDEYRRGMQWILVVGFPDSPRQLVQFEETVSTSNENVKILTCQDPKV